MTDRNTTPRDPFDTLRRLYNCNWTQLAARLGVDRKTLRAWRHDWPNASTNARLRLRDLISTALRASGCDDL